MERQVNHLVRLVDDLLEVSRISRGVLELRKERLEVAAIIRNAVETSAPLLSNAGHSITVSVPDEPLCVVGDSVRLAQVLANILNNAARYTGPRGSIRVDARMVGGMVEISVNDNGIGLAPDAIARIFEMFSREGSSGARGQGGLGVGLALARRLAEMHGGTIEARSAGPGAGTQFVIRLAAAAAPGHGLPARRRAGDGALARTRRILVVDDNHDSALALAMMLRMMGHEAHTAHDGYQALETAAALRPHMILLDLGMPGLSGYDTCRQLREQPWAGSVSIVALTGWGQEDERRRSREAGFDEHLVKPVDLTALTKLFTAAV